MFQELIGILQCLKVFRHRRVIVHDEFFDLEFVRAKIDEQTMLKSRGFEITKQLRDMFINERLGGLEFDNKYVLDQQVCKKITQHSTIFVQHPHRMLLLYFQAQFSQSMGQGILVNSLQMTVPMIKMDGISCLADSVTKVKDRFQIASSLRFFAPFCG